MKKFAASLVLLVAGLVAPSAAPPADYYTPAQGKAGAELLSALHEIIRGHNALPYSSTTRTDTREALRLLDEDPAQPDNVWLLYAQRSEPKATFGLTTGWNREHLWCDSCGLDGVLPAYTDLHNLRPEDTTVNSARGNKFYDVSDTNSPGYKFPAHAEALLCSTDTDSWEPPPAVQGDIARAMFYMATRYRGTASNEPALFLTDDTHLISSTTNLMGKLGTLLAWHAADPVDAVERLRNDRVYSLYQTNRNPFVDCPEWVNLTFAPAHTNRPALALALAPEGFALTWLATNQITRLEYATDLAGPWFTVTNVPLLTNSQWRVLWTNTYSTTCFRLRLP